VDLLIGGLWANWAAPESVRLPQERIARVRARVSGKAALVDERHYDVDAFRLGHDVAGGDLKAGQEWVWEIRLEGE